MSISSAPARYARAWPSPEYSHEFERDLVDPPDAAGREHDRLGREDDRLAGRPPVAERAPDAVRAAQEVADRALHVDRDPGRDRPVLERPDHLEPGPVADVGEARVGVAAERPLEDPPVAGPVEDGSPVLELADPVRRLLGVELGHPRVVEHLAADHRVAEVGLPAVAVVDVAQRRGDAALGHDRVGLAEERLADQADVRAGLGRLDRRPESRAAGADDEDVVGVALEPVDHRAVTAAGHRMMAGSVMTPSASMRT